MSLMGANEEDAAEATKTLIAIQSVSNGVKGIANGSIHVEFISKHIGTATQ